MEESGDESATPPNQEIPLGMSEMVDMDKSVVVIKDAWLESGQKKVNKIWQNDHSLTVKMSIEALSDVDGAVPGVIVANEQGEFITASNTKWGNHPGVSLKEGQRVTVGFTLPNLFEKGSYKVSLNIVSAGLDIFYDWRNEACHFESNRSYETGAKTNPEFKFKVDKDVKRTP
jgi:hypothetical protein